ncbi:MAG TPA: selenocysteine-specific translation elongation factor, partial [Gemmatimonadaceae bacterium]|nr:selenocysteine-specific translation elongation factor [Gemmatimonadaceae bacterium]
MILGTAGHIDHGKTALVKALTGVDTDRLPEEKRRGITIDLGFAPLRLDGIGTIGIVDVPGHEAFIRTMLAGASGIDIALLVIAADEGVMPQTEEHLEILALLGVKRGVVALTKADLVEDEWLALQADEVSSLLGPTAMASWRIIPVSAKTGAGISELKSAIESEANSVPTREASDDLFRMPVDRAFTVKGTGTVVTGTVWSGSISRDASLIVQPSGKTARVRGIEHHGVAESSASAGQRTAIALAGVDLNDVLRGSVLVAEPAWTSSSEIDALVEFNRADLRITPRTRVLFHLGTAEMEARLSMERAENDANDGPVRARIHLSEPVISRAGDRFVLRMPSPARTIGGGTVLDPYPGPRRRGRRKAPGVADLRDKSPAARLETLLNEAGTSGVSIASLPIRTGLSPDQLSVLLAEVGAIALGSSQYSRSVGEMLMKRVESIVSDGVANHPLEPGVSLQATRSAAGAGDELVRWAIEKLIEAGRIELSQSLVRPAGWMSKLGEAEQVLSNAIMHEICMQPSEPPSVTELEAKFGGKTRPLVRKLERDGRLERVSDDRYYSSEAVARIVDGMRAKLEIGRIYSPGELRDVLGVSRKYLIPFLEFCDRIGVTER